MKSSDSIHEGADGYGALNSFLFLKKVNKTGEDRNKYV